MEDRNMEIMLAQERKTEAAEILKTVQGLTEEQQKGVLAFIQGMKFAQNVKTA